MTLALRAHRIVVGRGVRPRSPELELAEALRVITAATRSGTSLGNALDLAATRTRGAVSAAFSGAASEIAIGVPVERALERLAESVDDPSARLFAAVISVQHRRGGDLGNVCYRLARLLHERGRLAHEARSITAQARFTARAVLAMPAVIALGWAWMNPESFARLLTPGMAVLLSPALLMLGVGILAVRRAARMPMVSQRASSERTSGVHRLLARTAGTGSITSQSVRLGGAAMALLVVLLVVGGANRFLAVSGIAAVALAAAWPAARARHAHASLVLDVQAGLPALLELTIALLAAGATPHEAILASIEGSPAPLQSRLAPALAQMRLGRAPVSALAATEAVRRVPEMDLWSQALAMGDRLGAPVTDVLETLLHDARTAERERFRQRAAVTGPRMQLCIVLLIVPAIMWVVLVITAHGMLEQLRATGIVG